jgi:hypothetical protein
VALGGLSGEESSIEEGEGAGGAVGTTNCCRMVGCLWGQLSGQVCFGVSLGVWCPCPSALSP